MTRYACHLILGLFILAGCSSKTPSLSRLPDSADPLTEINETSDELQDLKFLQADVFAKDDFLLAQESLAQAREMQRHQNPTHRDVLNKISEARAYSQAARKRTQWLTSVFADLPVARQRAIAAGAMNNQTKSMQETDRELISFLKPVQDSKDRFDGRKREALLAQYGQIEIEAMKKTHLGPARKALDQARREEAETYVPRTYANVDKEYSDAEAFIITNHTDDDGVRLREEHLNNSVRRLQKLLKDARRSQNISPEELALSKEEIARRNALLGGALARAETRNQNLYGEKAQLEEANQELSQETRINQLFSQSEKLFGPDEAEVYQQEKAILIRLKGLHFASGKANLSSRDLTLLEKVRHVIDAAGTSSIVVDGHTDSTGPASLNKKLSKERARTIGNYIQKNIDPHDSVSIRGWGFEKPISTNKTAQGRAENRRVDLLILPAI